MQALLQSLNRGASIVVNGSSCAASKAALDAMAAHSQIPLGRFDTSEEFASTVLHLAAAESAFIVGTEIIVDDGMSPL